MADSSDDLDDELDDAAEAAERRELITVWGPVVGITLIGCLIAWSFVPAAPPTTIVVATGNPEGAYFAYAKQYRELLAQRGIDVEVRPTAGSSENLELVSEGEAQIGFLQGGVLQGKAPPGVEAVCSTYLEPLWVFHRLGGEVDELRAFHGKRIAVGAPGSGTRPVALELLASCGISPQTSTLLEVGGREAVEALRSGAADVAFFVSSHRSALIRDLLAAPGVKLLDFARQKAHARRNAYLTDILLPEGGVDMIKNVPDHDVRLLAPAATLIVREDLPAGFVTVLLQAATEVHGRGGLFEDSGAFPSTRLVELPLSDEARRYFKSGPSFLFRLLPFGLAAWLARVKIMLVPLLTLLFPLIKIAPPVYKWRIRSRIFRWYGVLREIDLKLTTAPETELAAAIETLERLQDEVVNEVSVPLSYMDEFYQLRLHVKYVLGRVRGTYQLRTSSDGEFSRLAPAPPSAEEGEA